MVKYIYITFFSCLISLIGNSQSLISYTTVNPEEAYIGQPVQLKVSVYTSTWFTKGVDVGNIQVDGALTVYFRSVSNSRTFNGKKYAGVDFYYNLFPTQIGTITIPELDITVESPKEGDYKGIRHQIKTKPKSLQVKGVPLGYDANNWLVASSLYVSEKWSNSLKQVKVGDVLVRTISRNAGGTLAEFIPQTQWDSIAGVSLYPKRPKINTNKTRTAVSSSREESVSYLFEKTGEITIPKIEYVYWNNNNKKFYRKQIDSITLQVLPNEELVMLETLKNSLQKEVEEELIPEKKPFSLFGLNLKQLLIGSLLVAIALFFLTKLSLRLWKRYMVYKQTKLKSEAYLFSQVVKAIQYHNYNDFIKHLQPWLRKFSSKPINFQEFVNQYGTTELNKSFEELNYVLFKQKTKPSPTLYKTIALELKKARKEGLFQLRTNSKKSVRKDALNPLNFN